MDVAEEHSWNYAKLSFQSLEDGDKVRSSRIFQGDKSRPDEGNTKGNSKNSFTRLEDSEAPKDVHSKIYVAFILSGIGYMLPFTCFIVAVDYYQNRFPHSTIIFDMTTTTIIIGTIGVILNNALVEVVSVTWRVTFGYVVSTALLLFLVVCDLTAGMFDDHVGYWVTLTSVAVIAIGNAVQQSSFYGYANMLPRRYTQAVMVGESFAGVLVSLNRIITKLLLEDERINTIIFFIVSIVVITVCCGTFFLARETRFVLHHLNTCIADRRRHDLHDGTEFTMTQGQLTCFEFEVSPDPANTSHVTAPAVTMETTPNTANNADNQRAQANLSGAGDSCEHAGEGENIQLARYGRGSVSYGVSQSKPGDEFMGSTVSLVKTKQSSFKSRLLARWEVTKQTYHFMASFGLTYYVTVSLYPGIISEVVSCHLGTWMPVLLMTCFNVTDATGKTLSSLKQNISKTRLILCSLARICLIPLAIICCKPRHQPILSGEAWSILVALVLGTTNGYFGSLPLVLAPSQVAPRYRELCGNTMILSFTVGIICGAFTSYGLDLLVGPHPDLTFCHTLARTDNDSVISVEPNDGLKHY